MVLEKNLGSPLDYKEIKPINPKGNQPLIFISKMDADQELPDVQVGFRKWLNFLEKVGFRKQEIKLPTSIGS